MPKIDNTPKGLRPFFAHGIDLSWGKGTNQGVGDCPLCGHEEKLYVGEEEGLWHCKNCGNTGNPISFLRQFWTVIENTPVLNMGPLSVDRSISQETLTKWEIRKSPTTGEWVTPGRNPEGEVHNIYRYVKNPIDGSRYLRCTDTISHGLFGVHLYNQDKPIIYICEGPWDAMALYEVLTRTKRTDNGELQLTGNIDASLYKEANILGVPGTNSFSDKWTNLFIDKKVHILFDNDHPRINKQTGNKIPSAGLQGVQRIAKLFAEADESPKEVTYLKWGNADNYYDPNLKTGADVRDLFTSGSPEECTPKAKIAHLQTLFDMLTPIPQDWIKGCVKGGSRKGSAEIPCVPCHNWKELRNSWKKTLNFIPGLEKGLLCMLASVTSTMSVGDQLWLKIIGPPSCGKSTLAEAIAVNKKYSKSLSTITGFHSGYKSDGDGKKDNSLLSKCIGKTVIIKDGDTLLQASNLLQILSQLRDIYDGTTRVSYRNDIDRNYENFRMTVLLLGTSSLKYIDTSELGERFLDVVIMDGIDPEIEDDILSRVAQKAFRCLGVEMNGVVNSVMEPAQLEAYQLTGGYVTHLRTNANRLLKNVTVDPIVFVQCQKYAQLVAYMRSRPSTKQDESAERELAARLTSQLVRLAGCLAVVMNKTTIDRDVMKLIKEVALDTSRGPVYEICKYLFETGDYGDDLKGVSVYMHETETKQSIMLKFLRRIKALEKVKHQKAPGIWTNYKWRLHPGLKTLFVSIFGKPKTKKKE